MLFGRYASNRNEARHKNTWDNRQLAICPSIQSASGTRVFNYATPVQGSLVTGSPSTAWVRSGTGQAIASDAPSAAYWSVPNHPPVQIVGPITISFWANIVNNGAVCSLISKSLGSDGEFEILAIFTGGATSLGWRPGSATNLTTFFSGFTGAWNHFAFTCNNSTSGSTVACYRNGALAGTITTNLNRATSTNALTIGARPNGTLVTSAQIDDISIYNRVMTDAGVMRLFRMGRGGSYVADISSLAGLVSSSTNRRRRIICGASC